MTDKNPKENSKDLHIRIPAKLAKRVRAFALENDNTITGVVIEALDVFLREKTTNK